MKIGFFIHAFYEDVLPGIVEHVRRIPEPANIYISTTTQSDVANITAMCPEAEVRVFENRGRDVWPKLWGFADKYALHNVVLHLHTKKSVHSRGFRDWLDQILASLLGDKATISAYVGSLRAGEVGMICPPVHPKHIKSVRWRNNIGEAHKLFQQMGIEVSFDQKPFDFPVGSLFWSRADLLAPLLALDLPQSYFPYEQGQTDGTAAHAIERIYEVLATRSGWGLRYTDR